MLEHTFETVVGSDSTVEGNTTVSYLLKHKSEAESKLKVKFGVFLKQMIKLVRGAIGNPQFSFFYSCFDSLTFCFAHVFQICIFKLNLRHISINKHNCQAVCIIFMI